ncbi:hypothetical protein HPB47_015376 [Ixodes persulcatus]|uniref:Uncharacterized protein n=1 Tax=Ixodes persulcatus TaxID=34615 RepID=A0AC60QTN0_IXOPE|nr:hypothetical protein HPB47_015376 [Ixodes persulcatus]
MMLIQIETGKLVDITLHDAKRGEPLLSECADKESQWDVRRSPPRTSRWLAARARCGARTASQAPRLSEALLLEGEKVTRSKEEALDIIKGEWTGQMAEGSGVLSGASNGHTAFRRCHLWSRQD